MPRRDAGATSRRVSKVALAAALVAGGLALAGAPRAAAARTERTTYYRFTQVWPTAVRAIRVDEGYTITEKDEDTGYVLFQVKDDGKVFAGSLEVVREKDEHGRPSVRLILTIADRPAYMEGGILDRMLAKLEHEQGDPPPPAPPPDQGDKGKDKDKEQGQERQHQRAQAHAAHLTRRRPAARAAHLRQATPGRPRRAPDTGAPAFCSHHVRRTCKPADLPRAAAGTRAALVAGACALPARLVSSRL